ncbi:LysM peptidoglycan-binding domain-containing M23 family metallopeptidase [Streptomyces sp. NPDC091377]|uniref:LysM peptidoglycan-binding domain-containing M23 family metallopeptidase n=1 Tax=Streptomyces sp. NPDC091377 TaxID=3365995 RepID=UPI0037F37D6A
MPAKGKHRRTKSLSLTRSIAVAGTGGAALALPLMGATGAYAAPGQSVVAAPQSVSQQSASPSVSPSAGQSASQTSEKQSTTRTYSVKVGDYLAKIADEQDVSGGWQRIYEDNREAVGADPSLIHPGLKLTLGGKASGAAASETKPSAAPESAEAPASSGSTRSEESTKSTESTGTSQSSEATDTQASAPSQSAETPSTDTAAAGDYSLPVSGSVGTAYRMSGSMWSSGYHTGVDFSVPTGTSLKAVGAGTVVSAGAGGAYGNQVVLKLADGHYAQYAHLSSLSVSQGQTVTAGQQVGLSGATGNVTGPHLHFEIRTTPDYGSDVDPVAYLRSLGLSI